MGAQALFCFVAFFAMFVSSLTGKNTTEFFSDKVVVNVNLHSDKNVDTVLSQLQKKLESFEGRLNALEKPACKFDFEDGIDGWKKTGTAFNNQPTYGDNSKARGSIWSANQQGDWWIGGHENRPSKSAPAGKIQGDGPQGTLTSPYFTITGKKISFLIGGGCNINLVRAELIIGNNVVYKNTGKCTETMTRKTWDVGAFVGQRARVRLVDFTSGGWGHINFDDLKGGISCGPN